MYSQNPIAVGLNQRSPPEGRAIVRRMRRAVGKLNRAWRYLAQQPMRKAETLFLPIEPQHFVIVSDCFTFFM